MTILVGKHIDQIDFDSGRNIHTLPVVIGEKIARVLNIAAICAIYAIIAALIGFGRLTPFAAIVVFALSSCGPGDNAHESAATDLTSAWLYRLAALVPPGLSRA